jgi:hypothetical protein
MKISQIIQETSTTSGSIAPTELGFVKMQTRNPSVYGDTKAGNLLKGKKTNKPFANSLNEGAVKQLSMDLKELKDEEFSKKYKMTKQEARKKLSAKPEPVNEEDLSEQDLIVVPGQGRSRMTGFVSHDKDRTDHEVEMAVSDLFSAGKNAEKIYNMVRSVSEEEGLEGWVQEKIIKANDYLNTVREYLEGKQLRGVTENNQRGDSLVTDALKIMRGAEVTDAVKALKTVLGDREYNSRRGFYNFYIRQMLDAYGQKGRMESLGTTGAMTNGEMGESQLDELSPQTLGRYVKSASSNMAKRTGDTQFHKGARVATSAFNSKLPASRFEKDSKIDKRQAGIERAVDKISNEGAKVDRMIKHIAQTEKKLGHNKKEAENIAYATANKRGMLDNKNKKK